MLLMLELIKLKNSKLMKSLLIYLEVHN